MYNSLFKISDILKFHINNNSLLINSRNGIIFNEQILYQHYNEFNVCDFINSNYLFYGNLDFMILKNYRDNLEYNLNPKFSYYWNTLKNNEILICSNRRKDEFNRRVADYYWLNLITNKLGQILFIEKPQNIIFDNHLIIDSNSFLKSLSLLTGEYEWELDLQPELEKLETEQIENFIGVHQDILWISCSKALWGIDIHSGKILYTFTQPTQIVYQNGTLNQYRGYAPFIDTEKEKLIGFEHETYYELDLKNMSLQYWILEQECKAIKAFAPHHNHHKCYKDGLIYYIDNKQGTIAIFNTETKQFDWVYAFPAGSCSGILNDIQVSDDKLYVLDTGGTLHIFEKV